MTLVIAPGEDEVWLKFSGDGVNVSEGIANVEAPVAEEDATFTTVVNSVIKAAALNCEVTAAVDDKFIEVLATGFVELE